MSPRVVQLDRDLLHTLIDNERDALTAELSSGRDFVDAVMLSASYGYAFAMIDGGYVVVGAGLHRYWPGRAQAWWLISRHARPRHIVSAALESRAFLEKRQRDPSFRRVECYVREDERWDAIAFASHMGFLFEGRMPKYDPWGRDYLLFSRIREYR